MRNKISKRGLMSAREGHGTYVYPKLFKCKFQPFRGKIGLEV